MINFTFPELNPHLFRPIGECWQLAECGASGWFQAPIALNLFVPPGSFPLRSDSLARRTIHNPANVTPKQSFLEAIRAADRFTEIYELLNSVVHHRADAAFAAKFCQLVGWGRNTALRRVVNNNVSIVAADNVDTIAQFTHDGLSDLLRAALTAAVSALDKYLHDRVVKGSWKMLANNADEIQGAWKKIQFPVTEIYACLKKAKGSSPKGNPGRPGATVKVHISTILYKHTFQSTEEVVFASKLLGIEDVFQKLADGMGRKWSKPKVVSTLSKLVRRRNQIVHEADLIRKTKSKQASRHDVTRAYAVDSIKFIRKLVDAFDNLKSEPIKQKVKKRRTVAKKP